MGTRSPTATHLWCPDIRDATLPNQSGVEGELENYLGNPHDPTRPFSFERCLACDEEEVYPQMAEDAIRSWGAVEYLIPTDLGGRFGDVEQKFELLRAVARRDLTVAVSFGANLLAALPVWIAGTSEQRRFVAAILRGGESLALAATERGHGSDLLANHTHIERSSSGILLTGEKWLISNARRARVVVVFARTKLGGGPFGYSLFLLDKRSLPTDQWETLDRVRTVGLRGADVSGLRFRRCPIPDVAVLGDSGCAYETLHRTLTVTKTLCGGLALGAADTALRLVVEFAERRRLYGSSVLDIPHVQGELCGAFVDLMVCECVVRGAARALSDPHEPSLFLSALVKYFIPTTVERVLHSLSVVLGARFFLREGPEGFFQKVVRDALIISVFEGSTVVNLGILASQLSRRATDKAALNMAEGRRIKNLYSRSESRPPLSPVALSLKALQLDPAVALLPDDDGAEAIFNGWPGGRPPAAKSIGTELRRLRDRIHTWEELFRPLAEGYDGRPTQQSPRLLEHASTYCQLHAAASCWQTWSHSHHRTDSFVASGYWLDLCLRRLRVRAGTGRVRVQSASGKAVFGELLARCREGRSFSLLPG